MSVYVILCLGKLKDFPDYFETVLIPSMISRDQGTVGKLRRELQRCLHCKVGTTDNLAAAVAPGTSHCAGRHDGNRNPGHSQHMKWNTTGVCVEYLILSPSFFTFHI